MNSKGGDVMYRCVGVVVLLLCWYTAVQAYDVTLAWDCSNDCTTATSFKLYQKQGTDCSDIAQFSYRSSIAPGSSRTAVVTGLLSGQTYCWYITAVNAVGESGASNTTVFQVPVQQEVPAAPSNLHAVTVTAQVQVTAKQAAKQQQGAGNQQQVVLGNKKVVPPQWLNNDGTVTVMPTVQIPGKKCTVCKQCKRYRRYK